MTLISCESYPAYRAHVRRVTAARPANYGGHVGIVRALCGRRVAWDTRVPPFCIDGDIDCCESCAAVYERSCLRMTCCVCSRPDDNMLLAETHRPVCPACAADRGDLVCEMPSPPPVDVIELWGMP